MRSKQWHSPFRALLWKEWRESWPLLFAVAVGIIALGHGVRVRGRPETGLGLVFAAFLCGGMGARLFALESAFGTAHFLNERPARKGLVWAAKILLPAAALVVGLTGAATILLFSPVERLVWERLLVTPEILLGLASLAGLFSTCVFCSVLLDRQVTALAAGLVLLFLLGAAAGGILYLVALLIPDPSNVAACRIMAGLLTAEAVTLLFLSRLIYIRWHRD